MTSKRTVMQIPANHPVNGGGAAGPSIDKLRIMNSLLERQRNSALNDLAAVQAELVEARMELDELRKSKDQ